jgi:nitroreductase
MPLTRRRLVKRGLAGVTVIAAGGLVWRAVDSGVFAVGRGPAYEPWHEWRAEAAEGSLGVVQAGILAANAHNTQPWRFRIEAERIDLHADLARHLGSFDAYRREMHLSLGCALENMALAAGAQGFTTTVETTPGSLIPIEALRDDQPVATVRLERGPARELPLAQAIARRRTDRGAYDKARPVPTAMLAGMRDLVAPDEPVRVLLLAEGPDRERLGELIVAATETIVGDPEMAADSAAWFRFSRAAVQRHRDGVTLDAVGLPPLINAAAKMLPAMSAEDADRHWLQATREVHVDTAAVLGIILVPDLYDRAGTLAAGRVWQRLHLFAAAEGLAMQPLNQPPEVVDRVREQGGAPALADALAELIGERGWHPTFVFRAGYGERTPRLSPRRPVADVLLA